jgi:hypothetical protein
MVEVLSDGAAGIAAAAANRSKVVIERRTGEQTSFASHAGKINGKKKPTLGFLPLYSQHDRS